MPCDSRGNTKAQQISLRKNFYGGNGSLRTAISQDRKDTEPKSNAVESDDAELGFHIKYIRGVENVMADYLSRAVE